jgi:hypothetical protein
MSAVLGRSTDPTSRQMTYVDEDQTVTQSEDTAQVVAVDDRSSNLKYVMAIQSSTIWEEIKKRSLTISASQGLNDAVAEKSPDNLTDQELAQLKQACEDGLKCVAVDHLLMLKQVSEPLGGGKVSVQTAITKITQVVTQYTTEYHEDVYQYEAVQQSDDQYQVYKSVTTILEDNKELCQIDLTPATEQSQNGDGNTTPVAVDNNNTVNYNTYKNYNINNGTINNATINIEPQSGDETKPPVSSNALADTTGGPTVDESATTAAENKPALLNYEQDTETSDLPVTTTGDRLEPIGQQPMITDGPSPRDGDGNGSADIDAQNSGRGRRPRWSSHDVNGRSKSANTDEPAANNKIVLNHSYGDDASDLTDKNNKAADGVNSNTIQLDNKTVGGEDGGENDADNDIVSAGSHNINFSKKGLVEDGFLNNGNMKVMSIDNSNRNKGTLKDVTADNGIINVGTTNNGPVNYNTSKAYTNNGTISNIKNHDIRQYVDKIDKMYSTILEKFAKY